MIHTERITNIERLNNSTNGNPKYRISFDMANTYDTATDHMFAFSIVPQMEGQLAYFTLSKAGRITDLKVPALTDKK